MTHSYQSTVPFCFLPLIICFPFEYLESHMWEICSSASAVIFVFSIMYLYLHLGFSYVWFFSTLLYCHGLNFSLINMGLILTDMTCIRKRRVCGLPFQLSIFMVGLYWRCAQTILFVFMIGLSAGWFDELMSMWKWAFLHTPSTFFFTSLYLL